MSIDQERLREILNYNPETGIFTWRSRKGRKGARAGSVNNHGYVRIGLDGKQYQAHRLAWLYVHGWIPEFLDHINCIRHDNRIANLRPATKRENGRNQSKVRGIYRRPNGRYQARIRMPDGLRTIGTFDTYDEALSARKEAEMELFGEFAGPRGA